MFFFLTQCWRKRALVFIIYKFTTNIFGANFGWRSLGSSFAFLNFNHGHHVCFVFCSNNLIELKQYIHNWQIYYPCYLYIKVYVKFNSRIHIRNLVFIKLNNLCDELNFFCQILSYEDSLERERPADVIMDRQLELQHEDELVAEEELVSEESLSRNKEDVIRNTLITIQAEPSSWWLTNEQVARVHSFFFVGFCANEFSR